MAFACLLLVTSERKCLKTEKVSFSQNDSTLVRNNMAAFPLLLTRHHSNNWVILINIRYESVRCRILPQQININSDLTIRLLISRVKHSGSAAIETHENWPGCFFFLGNILTLISPGGILTPANWSRPSSPSKFSIFAAPMMEMKVVFLSGVSGKVDPGGKISQFFFSPCDKKVCVCVIWRTLEVRPCVSSITREGNDTTALSYSTV